MAGTRAEEVATAAVRVVGAEAYLAGGAVEMRVVEAMAEVTKAAVWVGWEAAVVKVRGIVHRKQ